MANVNLTAQALVRSGIDLTDNAGLNIVDTYLVQNDGRTWLHFKKTGAGACNVTLSTFKEVDGLTKPTRLIVVPATTGDIMAGPFPREIYNDPATGKLQFTLSEITGLTVAIATLGL